jgi:hypothetical protein
MLELGAHFFVSPEFWYISFRALLQSYDIATRHRHTEHQRLLLEKAQLVTLVLALSSFDPSRPVLNPPSTTWGLWRPHESDKRRHDVVEFFSWNFTAM